MSGVCAPSIPRRQLGVLRSGGPSDFQGSLPGPSGVSAPKRPPKHELYHKTRILKCGML